MKLYLNNGHVLDDVNNAKIIRKPNEYISRTQLNEWQDIFLLKNKPLKFCGLCWSPIIVENDDDVVNDDDGDDVVMNNDDDVMNNDDDVMNNDDDVMNNDDDVMNNDDVVMNDDDGGESSKKESSSSPLKVTTKEEVVAFVQTNEDSDLYQVPHEYVLKVYKKYVLKKQEIWTRGEHHRNPRMPTSVYDELAGLQLAYLQQCKRMKNWWRAHSHFYKQRNLGKRRTRRLFGYFVRQYPKADGDQRAYQWFAQFISVVDPQESANNKRSHGEVEDSNDHTVINDDDPDSGAREVKKSKKSHEEENTSSSGAYDESSSAEASSKVVASSSWSSDESDSD